MAIITPDTAADAVQGELWWVDAATLEQLDRLEGHPRLYERRPLTLASGQQAWVYLGRPRQVRHAPPLPQGLWPPASAGAGALAIALVNAVVATAVAMVIGVSQSRYDDRPANHRHNGRPAGKRFGLPPARRQFLPDQIRPRSQPRKQDLARIAGCTDRFPGIAAAAAIQVDVHDEPNQRELHQP